MEFPESSPATVKVICPNCEEDILVLSGAENTTWLCDFCGRSVELLDPPRSQTPIRVELKPRRLYLSPREKALRAELAKISRHSGYQWRPPGDPRIPRLVRGYGVAMIAIGILSSLAVTYGFATGILNEWSFPALPSAILAGGAGALLAVAEVVVGRGLMLGRRLAVYGAIVICAIALPHIAGWPMLIGLALVLPLFGSAGRHWRSFQ